MPNLHSRHQSFQKCFTIVNDISGGFHKVAGLFTNVKLSIHSLCSWFFLTKVALHQTFFSPSLVPPSCPPQSSLVDGPLLPFTFLSSIAFLIQCKIAGHVATVQMGSNSNHSSIHPPMHFFFFIFFNINAGAHTRVQVCENWRLRPP